MFKFGHRKGQADTLFGILLLPLQKFSRSSAKSDRLDGLP